MGKFFAFLTRVIRDRESAALIEVIGATVISHIRRPKKDD